MRYWFWTGLKTTCRLNIFKLFFFDIGLLGHLLGLSYNEHREQGFSYKGYIAENFVQNELVAAYNDLRDREFTRLFPNESMSFVEANKKYSDPRTSPDEKSRLKPKLGEIKLMYPQKLSEAEPSKTN